MKAAVITRYGSNDRVKVAETAVPVIGATVFTTVVRDALAYSESGRATGKVVISVV